MREPQDPVDAALKSLGGLRWPGDQHSTQLEKKLMAEFHTPKTGRRFGRPHTLLLALAILAVGGAAFAATGGVAMVKNWLVTTEINGEVVDVREVVPDEDGNAAFAIPRPPAQEGDEVTVTIDGGGSGGSGMKTVNVTLEDDAAQIEVRNEPEAEDP